MTDYQKAELWNIKLYIENLMIDEIDKSDCPKEIIDTLAKLHSQIEEINK